MLQEIITKDKDIMGGAAVFRGTRVTLDIFFDHLEDGISIDDFLLDYPTVSREQVIDLLESLSKLFESDKFSQIYEVAS
jgi:uncharacterized protein (DUF433 family)